MLVPVPSNLPMIVDWLTWVVPSDEHKPKYPRIELRLILGMIDNYRLRSWLPPETVAITLVISGDELIFRTPVLYVPSEPVAVNQFSTVISTILLRAMAVV